MRKFFISLGGEAQNIFSETHSATNKWLQDLLGPLKLQIAEHKAALDKRAETLRQVHENLHALESKIAQTQNEVATLQGQSSELDQMLLKLMQAARPLTGTAVVDNA